jgi:hypothetical protein
MLERVGTEGILRVWGMVTELVHSRLSTVD